MQNKTVVIIGATGGIGSVLSREFANEGARLVLSSRTESKLLALAETLGAAETLIVPADASKMEEVEEVFRKAKERFSSIDAVVIAAGTWERLSLDENPSKALDLAKKHFAALFLPTFVVGYAAQWILREQGHGLIANISSHAAIRPKLKGNLTYGPLKAASRHFMLALRRELEGSGVRVTDIEPAIVNTVDADLKGEERKKAVQPEDIARWIIEHFDDPNIPESRLFDSEIVLE